MRVEVTIQAASIKTHNEIRDNDLRSVNFLETDAFPVITFTSTAVEPAGEDRYTVTGDLTIKGNTRSVALQMTRLGEFNDPMMGHRIGYSGHAKINRKDFGLTFNPCWTDGSSSATRSTSCSKANSSNRSNRRQPPEPSGPPSEVTTCVDCCV